MELSEFAFRLILLFLPGVICASLVDAITVHEPTSQIRLTLHALVFGITSYALLFLVQQVAGSVLPPVRFFDALKDTGVPLSFREVGLACLLSGVIGCGYAFVANRKWLIRSARKLGLTKKIGELDVWGFIMNASQEPWVTVRDHGNDLAYDGWIATFSDDGEKSELVLVEAQVYKNSTGEFLYDIPVLYVSRERNEMTLEFRSKRTHEASNSGEGHGKTSD